MKIKLILAFFALLIGGNISFAQINITDPDQNPLNCVQFQNTGDANFLDSDPTGNYGPNENHVITICPDNTDGSKISIALGTTTSFPFDVDPSDVLNIYDGDDVTAPLVIALNNLNINGGFSFTASFISNPTGCLTFEFISDGAVEGSGWEGNLLCNDPAQPFTLDAEAYINGTGLDVWDSLQTNYIDVCDYDFIQFIAKPEFPFAEEVTTTGYSQTLENVEYEWMLSDGTQLENNDTVTFTPPDNAGFILDLTVTDIFPQSVKISDKIRVATKPVFAPITIIEDSICLGESSLLTADTITHPEGIFNTNLAFNHGTASAIPDGTATINSSAIPVSGYGGATVVDANSIEKLCLEIEHSSIENLEIYIECPNGTQVTLLNANNSAGELIPGGLTGVNSISLGTPDELNLGPGNAFEYCFTPVAAQTIGLALGTPADITANTTNNGGQLSLNAGDFLPESSFDDLAGCPVDGNWSLFVFDNNSTGANNGFLIDWSLEFDESLNPNAETYQNVNVHQHWANDPTITSWNNPHPTIDSTQVEVTPTMTGLNPYKHEVIDDFGCLQDTTVQLYVIEEPIIMVDSIQCDDTYQVAGTFTIGGGVWSSTDPANVTFDDNTADNPLITFGDPGVYTIYFTQDSCMYVDSAVVNHGFRPSIFTDTTACADTFQVVNTTSYLGGVWTITGGLTIESDTDLNPQFYVGVPGTTYTATFDDDFCDDILSANISFQAPITVPGNQEICNDTISGLAVTGSLTGGTWNSDSTQLSFFGSPTDNPVGIATSEFGVYPVTYFDNTCGTTDTISVVFATVPEFSLQDTITCDGMYQMVGVDSTWAGGVWTNPDAINVTITDETDDNPFVTLASPGAYNLTFTDNQCGLQDNILISYLHEPQIVGEDTVCALNTSLSLVQSFPAGGSWSANAAQISFDDNTLDAPTVTTTEVGTFWVFYTDNFCNKVDSIQMTFAPNPVTTTLVDTLICSNEFVVQGVTAFIGGNWTTTNAADAANVTFVNATDNNPTINFAQQGVYDLTYTDNQCGVSDNFIVEWVADPVITGTDTVCALTTNLALANVFANGGTWSASSPDITFNTPVTGDNVTITSSNYGEYTITYTEAYCNNQGTIQVFFAESPTTPFTDQTLCVGEYQVTGVTSFNGGTWTSDDVAAVSFTNDDSDNPLINISQPGVYVVEYTDNQCGEGDQFTIEYVGTPVIVSAQTVTCDDEITLSLNTPFTNGGTWSTSDENNTTFSNLTTDQVTVTALVEGTYTFTYTDDFCNNSDEIEITFAPQPTFELTNELVCDFEYQVTGVEAYNGGSWTISPLNGASFDDADSDNPLITLTEYGDYTITYTDEQCNISETATLNFVGNPVGSIGPDIYACDDTIAFDIFVFDDVNVDSYLWNTGDTGPSITLTDDGYYECVLTNQCGSDTTLMNFIHSFCGIKVPNVFTPNNDGTNDFFFVEGNDLEYYEIFIVNRWGNKVFISDDISKPWNGRNRLDGKICEEGVYYYTIVAKQNGANKKVEKLNGFLTLKVH